MEDLYNFSGFGGMGSGIGNLDPTAIFKAMEAGSLAGMQYNNQLNNGGSLQVESLDAVLKVLEPRLEQMVFLREIPKQKIENTVHQYNQLYKYGQRISPFNLEGETPQETDSVYRRKSVITKYLGVTGQVTHPAMLAKYAGGMDMYNKEVENKTILLQELLDIYLITGDSSIVPEQFDGVFRQHLLGINDIYGGAEGKTMEQLLDNYFNDPAVIDARGKALSDDLVEDACDVVVNDRNGFVDRIVSHTSVFSNYVKRFHESKRVIVGMGGSVVGASMGQSVNDITTQYGKVNIFADKFFDQILSIKRGTTSTDSKAPATPVIGGTPVAVATDTKTRFTDMAGTYGYLVTAVNRYGESAPLDLTPNAAQAVATTQSVDLQFTAGSGAYPATGFKIYRSKKNAVLNGTTEFYPIFEVSASGLAAGYDGAAAGKVRDRNRIVAGTRSALVYYKNPEIEEYLQFADTMKMDFAITAPSRRFAILNYGTYVNYQPGKVVRIVNIGDDITD